MGFYDLLASYEKEDIQKITVSFSQRDVWRALSRENCGSEDFLALLSPAARPFLEQMAVKARDLTTRHFGRTIQLFTPMYLSNFCTNGCVYCGFGCSNSISRKQLSLKEVGEEARLIAADGLKHILILTGDAPKIATPAYIGACCEELKKHFSSIAIEIYAMDTDTYRRMVDAGVDGLTLYQETYNETLYETLHPYGPKKDYHFRLDAPERGCMAGMRMVNVGALLGLDDWQRDAFFTGLHADWLQKSYPEVEVSLALPRMRPHAGSYSPACEVSDADFVQILLAQRIFMPRCGISISTRERKEFRDNIMGLGVTKMSAGVSTAVGGHSEKDSGTGQFDISDERSVEEMAVAIKNKGYQPVYQDWRPMDSWEKSA
ncbi:2-iminoacetate synthase ThiH [Desulfobotulus sp. H1]|uniref:2-iminoacetate synthase ThiH n=1 Tax=Desulfobotulus pelophilus TaxID=2823377 RepID=A0ABT3NBW3_9BACT|nr:2-iminoacetate synthase ThiH [Desulfobotulus pelophilus]MCW7754960.1 2-iminoacetate synthase ThiH [Desulfobotulus pelophilus]